MMKMNTKFLTIILLLTSAFSLSAQETIASIEFNNPTVSNDITLVVNNNSSAEAYTKFTTIGGKYCLEVPA
jgi:hypothetical protein